MSVALEIGDTDSRKYRGQKRGREWTRDSHGSPSRSPSEQCEGRERRSSRSHYGPQARDSRAPDRWSLGYTDCTDRRVSASRDGGDTTTTDSKSREATSDRSKTAEVRSTSPLVSRDKPSSECIATSTECVQVCENLNTVTSRTVLREGDC